MGFVPVSVVIPTYNRESLVPRAVRSALRAGSPDVIVVDDGSTDRTEAALEPYRGQIRYIRISNRGAGPARNRGIAEARHAWVALLDSDDEFLPDKLLMQCAVMREYSDVVMSFTDFMVSRAGHPDRPRYLAHWHRDSRGWDEILSPGVPYSSFAVLPPDRRDFKVHVGSLYSAMLVANYVATFTAVLARDRCSSDDVHFSEGLAGGFEDWECFARLARKAPVAFLDCDTARNWGHDGPRLTQDHNVAKATSRLEFMGRLWGSDPGFLQTSEVEYKRTVAEVLRDRARFLMAEGRMTEARRDLRLAGRVPFRYRATSWLPGAVASWLVRRRL